MIMLSACTLNGIISKQDNSQELLKPTNRFMTLPKSFSDLSSPPHPAYGHLLQEEKENGNEI